MNRRDWRLEALGWDGALPLVVALTPEVLLLCLPDPLVAKFFSVGVVPLFAALFRAHQGEKQIHKICPGEMALGRQCLFALAIIVVLLFEGTLAVLQCERVPHLKPWLAVLGMYLVYLGLVAVALRPKRVKRSPRKLQDEPWRDFPT